MVVNTSKDDDHDLDDNNVLLNISSNKTLI